MNRQQQIDQFLLEAHQLALARLREHPERLVDVAAQLQRWRVAAGASRSDPYWDEWDALLRGGVEVLAASVGADTDHAAALRSVSPMSVLITQRERSAMLRNVRPVA